MQLFYNFRQRYFCAKARLIWVFWIFLAFLADWSHMNVYRWLRMSFFFGLLLHVLFNWWQWIQAVCSRQKSLFLISIISACLSICMYNYIKTKILEDYIISKPVSSAKNIPYFTKFLVVHSPATEFPEYFKRHN